MGTDTVHCIAPSEVEEMMGARLSPRLRDRVAQANLRYADLTETERDAYLLTVVEALMDPALKTAGEHRLSDWEQGWSENLRALKSGKSPADLVPRYHGKHSMVRWRRRIVRPLTDAFDYRVLCLLVDWAVESFLGDVAVLHEFGCGPAYHLLRAREFLPTARLVGLDWARASQRIIAEIKATGIDANIEGRPFDFFAPAPDFSFPANSGVLTVAALEQVGDRFEPFLQFLLAKKPAVCVHLEPIDELMDPLFLVDRLSVLYCRKRQYLHGFLTRLRRLRDEGRIKIFREQRTFTGSHFIEGHSLVVWSPV